MTRLIEADAVYKILESCEIREATIGYPLTDWEYGYTCGIERAESEIECAPTVDAVPVIRCKDCKYCRTYYHGENMPFSYACAKLYLTSDLSSDDYCSRGVRKDD